MSLDFKLGEVRKIKKYHGRGQNKKAIIKNSRGCFVTIDARKMSIGCQAKWITFWRILLRKLNHAL